VPVAGLCDALFFGPAAVSIKDDANVLREVLCVKLALD